MREARDTITAKNQEHYLALLKWLDEKLPSVKRRESPTWYTVEVDRKLARTIQIGLMVGGYSVTTHHWGPA